MYHKYRKKKEKPVNHKKQFPNKPDHIPSRPDPRFRLQNTLGNQRVGQFFKEMEIMTKLVMNEQGNVYEQEANKIAGQIVETKDTDNKEKAPDIMLQKKADVTISTPVSSEIESEIASLKGKGQPLEKNLKDYMEPRFGADFSDVRIHRESNADRLARAVRARAFTLGNDIAFARDQYNPGTKEGKKLVAHELTHVLQQQKPPLHRQAIQRQENTGNTAASYAQQIIAILDDPSNFSLDHGCQRAWEILVTLDDDLFVKVINEIKNSNYYGIVTNKILVPLRERERIMALIGTPADRAIYDFKQILKAEACRRLDKNRRDLDRMEEEYRENLRVMDTSYGRYIRNSANTDTLFSLYRGILLDNRLQKTQTILSNKLDYIQKNIHGWETTLGADALLEENTIYEVAAKKYRDFLSQRVIIQELLQRNTQKRMDLRDIFPAINVLTRVDRNEINDGDPPGVERIAGMIFDGFKRARGFQDETRKKILNGDMPVYKLDILTDAVKDIVKAEGRWEEPYSTAVENWLEGQKTAEWVFNLAGTAVEIGLTIAAFFTGGTTAVLLGLAGGAVGLGMAAYNFEIAEDIQDAAEAGRGGSYQFADVDEANINMFFATLDLFLSAIDFVLSATNALELVDNVNLRKMDLDLENVDDVIELGDDVMKGIGKKISQQKQLRHVQGTDLWNQMGQKSYFQNIEDAQEVLDAFHSRNAQFLGKTSSGNIVIEYNGVTGFNNNPGAGFLNQPTNTFMIKGTKSVSVVPVSPGWGGN